MSPGLAAPRQPPIAFRVPRTVVGRDEERATVRRTLHEQRRQHLHLAGPRGSGKTLLTTVTLRDAVPPTVCYVPCQRYNTQYQVLTRLTERLTGEPVTDGYRTAHLQRRAAAGLADTPAVLVLDDVEFLLQNDGDDLLYGLLRLARSARLTIITIATPAIDLTTALDPRTYSSFQPQHLRVAPYTVEETGRILATHAADMVPQPVTDATVQQIAQYSTNVRVGLHWLARAAEIHDASAILTAETIPLVRQDALHRYWLSTLTDFTRHHAIALKAVEQVTGETDRVYTGRVYDRYATLCRCRGWQPLTTRRISDFLDHLELLGLIQVEHHRGGAEGKTRIIRLTPLEEL